MHGVLYELYVSETLSKLNLFLKFLHLSIAEYKKKISWKLFIISHITVEMFVLLHNCMASFCVTCLGSKDTLLWGSPYRHWNRIQWIQIPSPDSMWSRVSSKRHEDCTHCTAGLDLTHCPTQHSVQLGSGSRSCGCKMVFGSRSSIHIGSRSKVPCGEPLHPLLWCCLSVVKRV